MAMRIKVKSEKSIVVSGVRSGPVWRPVGGLFPLSRDSAGGGVQPDGAGTGHCGHAVPLGPHQWPRGHIYNGVCIKNEGIEFGAVPRGGLSGCLFVRGVSLNGEGVDLA